MRAMLWVGCVWGILLSILLRIRNVSMIRLLTCQRIVINIHLITLFYRGCKQFPVRISIMYNATITQRLGISRILQANVLRFYVRQSRKALRYPVL